MGISSKAAFCYWDLWMEQDLEHSIILLGDGMEQQDQWIRHMEMFH